MVYAFCVIIIIFFFASFWYLKINSFSPDTLAVIFPAIGAILLSGYLGFKSIYLDAPPPKKFSIMNAIFHDYEKGQIKSLVPRGELKYVTRFNMMTDFQGSILFDTLQNDSAFKDLNINTILQNSPIGDDSDVSGVMIGHFIEYAILKWMCNPEMRADYSLYYSGEDLINTLGGYGATIGRDLVETSMVIPEKDPNPLMQAKPLMMNLPKGSKITRYIDDLPLKFKIITPHSSINIVCSFGTDDQLGIPFHEDAKRFYKILGWSNNVQDRGLYAYGINVEFTVDQISYRRFSNQAKLEAKWLNRISEQLEKGFSWTKLKKVYMQEL